MANASQCVTWFSHISLFLSHAKHHTCRERLLHCVHCTVAVAHLLVCCSLHTTSKNVRPYHYPVTSRCCTAKADLVIPAKVGSALISSLDDWSLTYVTPADKRPWLRYPTCRQQFSVSRPRSYCSSFSKPTNWTNSASLSPTNVSSKSRLQCPCISPRY